MRYPFPLTMIGAGRSGGSTFTTVWNAADKDSHVALSGGNLIASVSDSGGGTSGGVRGDHSRSTGKSFYEARWNKGSLGSPSVCIGLALATADLTTVPRVSPTGWAILYMQGTLQGFVSPESSGQGIASATSPADGDLYGVATDHDAGLVWIQKNGTWLDFGSGDDPNTATGGGLMAAGGAYFPACFLGPVSGADSLTANFGATTFTHSPPTGFSAFNG